MKQQEILKKIGGIIAELKEQYTYLDAAESSFNDLELELFMANANFLTDHIEILKKINVQAKPDALPAVKPVLALETAPEKKPEIPDYFSEEEHLQYADEPVLVLEKNIPVLEKAETELPEATIPEIHQPETIVLPEVMPTVEIANSPVVDDASFTEQKLVEAEKLAAKVMVPEFKASPEIVVQPAVEIQPKAQPEIVYVEEKQSEQIKQEPVKPENAPVLTLNERIAAQKGLDQSKTNLSETAKNPVQDLQMMISLNDKLLFVKELFNGYNLAYSEAINILNRYTTFEQAEHFLKLNYTVKNNWQEKPATSEKFFDLLRKRFE
jgi:hypothetical protein